MVNEIIDVLNHTLDGFMPGQKVYGLAQTVLRIQGSVEEYLPALVARDGELTYVGIDDTVPVIIYHKLGGMTTQQQTRGFGDGVGDVVNTFTMALVVYWSRKRLNVYPHEMVPLIQARFPQLIRDVPNIKITRIRISSANLNTIQVYKQEYLGTEFKLPENSNLIQLNYNIETVLKPDCLPICAECPQ